MAYIRRCFLALVLATLAACSTIPAPSLEVQLPSEKISVNSSDYINPSVKGLEGKGINPSLEVKASDIKLAEAISHKYKCAFHVALEAVKYASQYSYVDFPRKEDILAIVGVESSFNPNAKSGGSRGVMQVLVKTHRNKIQSPFGLKEQIRVGTLILRENFVNGPGTAKSAVMSYNVGLGAYLRGARPTTYYLKYSTQLTWFKTQEQLSRLV